MILLHHDVDVVWNRGVAVIAAACSDAILVQNVGDGFLNLCTATRPDDGDSQLIFAAERSGANSGFKQKGSGWGPLTPVGFIPRKTQTSLSRDESDGVWV